MPFGPLEIIIVLLIILVVFGAKKLPEMGKSLGSGMREFRDGVSGREDASSSKHDKKAEPASLQKAPQDDPAAASTAAATGSAPQAAEETVTAEPVIGRDRDRDREHGTSSSS